MQAIVELATRLGKAIAASPQAQQMRKAREDLNQHEDVVKLLEDFRTQSEKIGQLESDNKPVEVDDKHRLQDLHDRLIAADVFKAYTAAQVEYIDLMRKVNQALDQQLVEIEGQESDGD